MKHFTMHEFTQSPTARRLGIDNTPPPEAQNALTRLVEQVLDPLREAWGRAITVTSGYRCPRLNAAVGGTAYSQHMKGEAADVTTGSREGNRRLYDLLVLMNLPYDQLINERNFAWLHISHSARRTRRQRLAL
ncbi:MAG: peptidase M15 [Muribaculaceae bacterium]|nr:peptidase M15 [Muribaculaceae bacterium]